MDLSLVEGLDSAVKRAVAFHWCDSGLMRVWILDSKGLKVTKCLYVDKGFFVFCSTRPGSLNTKFLPGITGGNFFLKNSTIVILDRHKTYDNIKNKLIKYNTIQYNTNFIDTP